MTTATPHRHWLKLVKKTAWLVSVGAVLAWSVWLLYSKLLAEVSTDPAAKALIDAGGLWADITVIVRSITGSLSQISLKAYLLAGLSAMAAYVALAWYDRIALIYLRREKEISWLYIAVCSFVTYALGHNLGASVFSGGLVRLRAYTAKGLTATEVAILVTLCSFTFAFGTLILTGFVFVVEPEIVQPLADVIPVLALPPTLVRTIGIALLLLCALYVLGSWLHFKPLHWRALHIVYPRLPIVGRQLLAAPLEIIAAAGIIHFALPEAGHPGFLIVLGAFLLSFSAGLLSQTPGGIGVMEAVFLALMSTVSPSDVVAALLIWRLMYLLIPLALSLPVVVAFERSQLHRSH